MTPLINNDVFLVVPKAFHALDVAIVEAFNVSGSVLNPGEFVQAVQNGRTNILGALNQPVGSPTTPTGATNIAQVLAVSAVDVTTAVAFRPVSCCWQALCRSRTRRHRNSRNRVTPPLR